MGYGGGPVSARKSILTLQNSISSSKAVNPYASNRSQGSFIYNKEHHSSNKVNIMKYLKPQFAINVSNSKNLKLFHFFNEKFLCFQRNIQGKVSMRFNGFFLFDYHLKVS